MTTATTSKMMFGQTMEMEGEVLGVVVGHHQHVGAGGDGSQRQLGDR